MEAAACRRLAPKVRDSGAGLYAYLSSGKSSAMAMSLRPMSFHCSSTASEGLSAGFGSAFFMFMSCARIGSTARHAANKTAAKKGIFLIFLSFRFPGRGPIYKTHELMGSCSRAGKVKKLASEHCHDTPELSGMAI